MKTFCIAVLFSWLTLCVVKADNKAITSLVDGKLVHLDNGKLSPVDISTLSNIKYFAIYYSAGWCPPCHQFTPKLVEFYNRFKSSHPEFELIFVNEDYTAEAMQGYMTEMSMPWPAVRFDALIHHGHGPYKRDGIESYAYKGIPDLVLVDSTGKVLSDSFEGENYVGPYKVVNYIKTMFHFEMNVAFNPQD